MGDGNKILEEFNAPHNVIPEALFHNSSKIREWRDTGGKVHAGCCRAKRIVQICHWFIIINNYMQAI